MRYNSILKEFNPNTFLTDYLQAKGIQGGEIEEFLHPDEKVLDNPFDYKNMDKAVEELSVLKQKNDMWGTKKIGVLIDCDVDGIMSASIISDFVLKLGIKPENLYLYAHNEKAHGLGAEGDNLCEKMIQDELDLVFTPDSSSNDIGELKFLTEQSISVIVLDHHEVETESNWGITINHHLSEGLNKSLSGAGVTDKFVRAFCKKEQLEYSGYEDFVAISLVSDVCNLRVLENRWYIEKGLKNIKHPALKMIVDKFCRYGVSPKGLSFGCIPPMNALTRLSGTLETIELVKAIIGIGDMEQALKMLSRAHRTQKKTVKDMTDELQPNMDNTHKVAVGFADDENRNYIGLVANKIRYHLNKPTFVLRDTGASYTGSLRSPIDLLDILNESGLAVCQGHQRACGITFKKENYDQVIDLMDSMDLDVDPPVDVAAKAKLSDLDIDVAQLIEDNDLLWGEGVELPTFYTEVKLNKDDVHVYKKRATFIRITGGDVVMTLPFASTLDKMKLTEYSEFTLQAVVELEVNEYNGYVNPQCKIIQYEVVPVETKEFEDLW